MKLRFSIITICFFLSSQFAFGGAPAAQSLLTGVQLAREKIPPSRLTVETTYSDVGKTNELSWVVEFEGELRRYEVTRPEQARTMFDGRDAMVYSGRQVSLYNLSANATASPLHDPRIMGITGVPSCDMTVKTCFPYQFSSKVETIGPEEIEARSTWHVKMTYRDGGFIDWWIDVENNFRVVRYEEKWLFGSRSLKNWYENSKYPWLPSRILTEEFLRNGDLRYRIEDRIVRAEANITIPKITWSLAGFNLPRKTIVLDTRKHTFGYWIDGRVMPAEEWNKLGPGESPPQLQRILQNPTF